MRTSDEIAAIATPPGNGGVGIIRISGSRALDVLEVVWEGSVRPSEFEPRRVYVGRIAFDQVLAFFLKAPSSYTGEDVVEVQAHGGRRGLELLLERILKAGARMAHPGEFTKRAFLNGRMDLAQAEAVADLIAGASERAVVLAGRQLEGRLSEYVGKLRNEIKVMRAQMEARIDFPEDEDVQGLRYEEVLERLASLKVRIESLLASYEEGRYLREGVRVAIVGKPNAGKSSLFNALVGDDRAIVHPMPGTTRDTVEEVLDLEGLAIRFIDTAGIRPGEDGVEAEGIRRSRQKIDQADLSLFVLDSSRPWDVQDDRVQELIGGRRALTVFNKTDLSPAFDPPKDAIRVSAKTGEGVEGLKKAMAAVFSERTGHADVILTNLRHRDALLKGAEALERVGDGARAAMSLELLAADLAIAMNALGEVTGEVTNDEILGEIFSKFCIGK
ncbi:MAG TPA: tRNA uridine-5-carboxymethylaminomethyl(34) synthesis GTPase MnmE [bacterium]|nr:tRNA uridine-5-carboxymethylaminomethyl(34) synthesis GTPase MnmE [bacterium]